MGVKRTLRRWVSYLRLGNYIKYRKDLANYVAQCADGAQFRYESKNAFPVLGEWNKEAGDLDDHYFFQDIWMARQIAASGAKHVHDIGSRVDGYIAHLLSMGVEVTMIDVRPLKRTIAGLHFVQADATSLESIADASLSALSSLHALEHFGLGRYGDPVDYLGWKKALRAMTRKVQPGGHLYLSVPVGREEKLMFNAHRIFSPLSIVRETEDAMATSCFALDHGGEVSEWRFAAGDDVKAKLASDALPRLGGYDCGMFVLRKK